MNKGRGLQKANMAVKQRIVHYQIIKPKNARLAFMGNCIQTG